MIGADPASPQARPRPGQTQARTGHPGFWTSRLRPAANQCADDPIGVSLPVWFVRLWRMANGEARMAKSVPPKTCGPGPATPSRSETPESRRATCFLCRLVRPVLSERKRAHMRVAQFTLCLRTWRNELATRCRAWFVRKALTALQPPLAAATIRTASLQVPRRTPEENPAALVGLRITSLRRFSSPAAEAAQPPVSRLRDRMHETGQSLKHNCSLTVHFVCKRNNTCANRGRNSHSPAPDCKFPQHAPPALITLLLPQKAASGYARDMAVSVTVLASGSRGNCTLVASSPRVCWWTPDFPAANCCAA